MRHDDKILYTSGDKNGITLSITCEDVQALYAFRSNQEEADTRLVLHVVAAAGLEAKTVVYAAGHKCPCPFIAPSISHESRSLLSCWTWWKAQPAQPIHSHLLYICATDDGTEQLEGLLPVYYITGHEAWHYQLSLQTWEMHSISGHNKLIQKFLLASEESVSEIVEMSSMRFVGCTCGKRWCTLLKGNMKAIFTPAESINIPLSK